MKAVSAEQIRELDRRALEAGVRGRELMEAAGGEVGRVVDGLLRPRDCRGEEPPFPFLVLACKGNNGGDALVAARALRERLHNVCVALFCAPSDLRGAARGHFRLLQRQRRKRNTGRLQILRLRTAEELDRRAGLARALFVVDGLFGTGLRRPLEPPFDEVARRVNSSRARVVSVDLPSGLHADTGEPMGAAMRADVTVTMGLPKVGMLKEAAVDYVGKLIVARLPYPPQLIAQIQTDVNLIHQEDVRSWLPRRKFSAHKGDFGHAFLVAGSQGLTGAANLCATACARAGAGLTTLAVPEDVYPILAAACPPEVMVRPLFDSTLEAFAARANALACGCGLGQSPEAKRTVETVIRRWPTPMVLDADALNNIAANPEILRQAQAPVLITPHAGEMARLLGTTAAEVNAERWNIARNFARQHNCIVVLKGARTVVSDGRELWVNATGNPAMASGGVGDALTGILAGLLAQRLAPFDAARAAVYLHGLAGDLAAEKLGSRALLAGELLGHLPAAFAAL